VTSLIELGHPEGLRRRAHTASADRRDIHPNARLAAEVNENITLNMQYLRGTAESRT
jgi:hypothetical protein